MTAPGVPAYQAEPESPLVTLLNVKAALGDFDLAETARAALLLDALVLGLIELRDLPRPLADFYAMGHLDGRDSLRPQLARAEWAADRLYMYAFNPSAPRPGCPSFADLARIRGDHQRGARADAHIAQMFDGRAS